MLHDTERRGRCPWKSTRKSTRRRPHPVRSRKPGYRSVKPHRLEPLKNCGLRGFRCGRILYGSSEAVACFSQGNQPWMVSIAVCDDHGHDRPADCNSNPVPINREGFLSNQGQDAAVGDYCFRRACRCRRGRKTRSSCRRVPFRGDGGSTNGSRSLE